MNNEAMECVIFNYELCMGEQTRIDFFEWEDVINYNTTE
jgi:hypothetical protein